MPFPAHVISLARRPERRERFLRWNGAQEGIAFTFVDAVDGRLLDRSCLVADGLLAPDADYSPGALGNALSHRALWEEAAGRNEPTLVFEDDACLQRRFPAIESCLACLPEGWDFLMLGYNTNAIVTLRLPNGMPVSLSFGKRHPWDFFEHLSHDASLSARPSTYSLCQAWGTLAYLVSPQGAARMMKACFPLAPLTLDVHLQGRAIQVFTADGMINVGLARGALKGFALFPPVALGPNAADDSDVV
ncbi:MAG TPA: glycosyltransferase family 25 protein [Holophaga sp.]|nr:glycosyltransferase family 25 protein [Holophaga sp.]